MAFIIKHAGTVTDTLQCTALSLNKQPFGLIIARIFAKAARRTVSPDTFRHYVGAVLERTQQTFDTRDMTVPAYFTEADLNESVRRNGTPSGPGRNSHDWLPYSSGSARKRLGPV
jgi:hypothetical protein